MKASKRQDDRVGGRVRSEEGEMQCGHLWFWRFLELVRNRKALIKVKKELEYGTIYVRTYA